MVSVDSESEICQQFNFKILLFMAILLVGLILALPSASAEPEVPGAETMPRYTLNRDPRPLGGSLITTCGRVVEDKYQAMECLNLSIHNDVILLPIVLDSTIGNGFICETVKVLYTFSCSIYTLDLIWYFNDQLVAGFFPSDKVGTLFSRSFPDSAPAYNFTIILSQKTLIGEYGLILTTSTLIVQPFNESESEVIPFSISCQSHCMDENNTAVCKTKYFNVAARPARPKPKDSEIFGSIQVIDNKTAFASINWMPPQNKNQTAIDYYDVTLIGSDRPHSIHVAATQLTFSYKYKLSDGNYTEASIEAVDVCGQRSEPTNLELIFTNKITSNCTKVTPTPCNTQQTTVDILAGILAAVIAVLISSCIVFCACITIVRIRMAAHAQKTYELENYSQ